MAIIHYVLFSICPTVLIVSISKIIMCGFADVHLMVFKFIFFFDLASQGLYCSLRQLLEVGFFHADPHPGNLVAMADGSLAYFDFGMMGDIPRHFRVGLIQVVRYVQTGKSQHNYSH